RPAEQQSLHAREAVDHRRLGSPERELVGLQRNAEPAQVADVLANGERAIDVILCGEALGNQRVVLCDERLGALLERLAVSIRPPVIELARTVIATALVVEAVPDLMS